MRTSTLTPYDFSVAEKVGKRTFRKQILKKGTINYKGQKINFDKKMMLELARNFKKGAYDQVPFQFANGANEHNEDPRNFSGEMVGVELTADGLDGIFELTAEGIKAVKKNPRLGVSARIMGSVEHSDGRAFGRSIRHVLATMNPRVTGMKPWQAVDLSEEEETEVVDLTAETYKEGTTMAKKKTAKGGSAVISVTTTKGSRQIDLSELSDDEFQTLLDLSTPVGEDDEDEDLDDDDEEDDDADDDEDDSDDDSDDDDSDEDDEDDDDTDLSVVDVTEEVIDGKKSAKKTKKVTKGGQVQKVAGGKAGKNPFAKKGKTKVSADLSIHERLAQSEWRRERRDFARAGVPPHLLDLAEPVLSAPDAVMLDLSAGDDDKVDASAIIRQMLESTQGFIDIKPEIGHSIDLSVDEPKDSPAKALADAWDQEYGKA